MNDLANTTARPALLAAWERLEHAPKGGETHHAYLARLERNQAAGAASSWWASLATDGVSVCAVSGRATAT